MTLYLAELDDQDDLQHVDLDALNQRLRDAEEREWDLSFGKYVLAALDGNGHIRIASVLRMNTIAAPPGTFRRGQSGLGLSPGLDVDSVIESVSDGDTVRLGALGSLSSRLLGVDTAESRFRLLRARTADGGSEYQGRPTTHSQQWQDFLTDPFTLDSTDYLGAVGGPLPPYNLHVGLQAHLQPRLGASAAINHRLHATEAHRYLENQIVADMQLLGHLEAGFRFFYAFAHELMDGYGRLLCILKPDEPDTPSGQRQDSYNIRLLRSGMAAPYFIWPNLEPWREQELIVRAARVPFEFRDQANNTGTLQRYRRLARDARAAALGIWGNPGGVTNLADGGGPLRILPFELRYLASRRPPPRHVIDLNVNDDHLLRPEYYYTIPNPEDRLFIPSEYVPLFVERGWRIWPP